MRPVVNGFLATDHIRTIPDRFSARLLPTTTPRVRAWSHRLSRPTPRRLP